MKIQNYLGENMPKMPWMINFDCPTKKICAQKTAELYPANYLEYLTNLKLDTKRGRAVLTTLICTLGTKNTDPDFINNMLQEGIRSVSIDMSMGSECEQLSLLNTLRGSVVKFSEQSGREYPLAIAIELTGLRIRTGRLDSHDLPNITLEAGAIVYLTTDTNYECHCNKKMIYVNYPQLLKVLTPGNKIFFDYGAIILEVIEIGEKKKYIKCRVINGGQLRDEAIIELPQVPLEFENVIRSELITFALKHEIDALILSKVRNAHVIDSIRIILGDLGKAIMLIAKIEDTPGIGNIDDIIESADAIIISRAELGMDLPPEKLFIAQKMIIAKCNKAGKPVICGTHVLKSMHKSRLPSRADMLDVPNAILDGTDGILISEEVTTSPYFFEAVHILQNMCLDAESTVFQKDVLLNLMANRLPENSEPTYSIAMTAIDLSVKCNAACIIVVTVSGRSAKLIAQYRPKCPVIAVTRYGHVARKLNLWRGVIPLHYIAIPRSDWLLEIDTRLNYAITFGKFSGLIKGGEAVIIVSGKKEFSGFTNTVRIVYASQNKIPIKEKNKKEENKENELQN